MVKTVEELKELILWAKKERIQALKVGDIEVHMSALAFTDVPDISAPDSATKDLSSTTKTSDVTLDGDSLSKEEEDAILFHSSR